MDKIIKLSYDRDMCPDNDSVISQVTCKNCEYYKGFELCNGIQCTLCGSYSSSCEEGTE